MNPPSPHRTLVGNTAAWPEAPCPNTTPHADHTWGVVGQGIRYCLGCPSVTTTDMIVAERVAALQEAVNDRMCVPGWVLDPVDRAELRACLPNTPIAGILDVFDEMRSFRIDMERCDESEPAHRHAQERFDALAEAAVTADMEAAYPLAGVVIDESEQFR